MQLRFLASTVNECSPVHVTFAPSSFNISHMIFTSLIFGTFSKVVIPSIRSVAGSIATAAFFAPLISTSPLSFVFPFITNLFKI